MVTASRPPPAECLPGPVPGTCFDESPACPGCESREVHLGPRPRERPGPVSRCGAVFVMGYWSRVRAPTVCTAAVTVVTHCSQSPTSRAPVRSLGTARAGGARRAGPRCAGSCEGLFCRRAPPARPFPASGPASHARVVAHLTSTSTDPAKPPIAKVNLDEAGKCLPPAPGPRPEAGVSPGGMTAVQSPGLTPRGFLQKALAQVDDLRLVSMLDMCVDTREHSLGNFGESPPRPHPPPPRPDHSPRVCSLGSCLPGSGLRATAPLFPGIRDCHRARL